MKFDEILANITMLAETQGFYRSLLKRLNYNKDNYPNDYKIIQKLLEEEHFEDIFDMCTYFESKLNNIL